VPKTHSVATFKSTVKDVLADEDVVGEEIRSARLKGTYAANDRSVFMHTEQMVVGFDHKGAVDVGHSEI
jgi:hypothetical protein